MIWCVLVMVLCGVAWLFKSGNDASRRAGLLSLMLAAVLCGAADAQQIEAVPNTPVASGDAIWIVRDGQVIKRYTDKTFTRGNLVDINGVLIGEALCPPRRQPEPPAFPPPQFDLPKPDAPMLPPPVVEDSGPNLLQIAIFVAALVGGYYVGRQAAGDDDDAEKAPEEAAVA